MEFNPIRLSSQERARRYRIRKKLEEDLRSGVLNPTLTLEMDEAIPEPRTEIPPEEPAP